MLDASLSAAWFISDPEAGYAVTVRNELAAGVTAVVPAIWPIEMASTLAKAVRRRFLTEESAEVALQQLEVLTISGPRISIDSHLQPMREVYTAARKHDLSAYDSLYLELALSERLPLATLDKNLRAAAKKAGVKLFR